jgi:hypothetical protein
MMMMIDDDDDDDDDDDGDVPRTGNPANPVHCKVRFCVAYLLIAYYLFVDSLLFICG